MNFDPSPFWHARSPRERLLLTAAAGLGAVWIAFALVWQPMQDRRARIEQRIAQYDGGLARLLRTGNVADPAPGADPRPVAQLVTALAEAQGLTIRRLDPEGTLLRVTLEDAPFATVLIWLEKLETDSALQIMSLTLTRRPAPGQVSTLIAVQR